MSKKINYFSIGVFILIGTFIFTVAVIVFGGGNFFRETLPIETYFDGSVQGLNIGSPIKFRGIKIGEVTDMSMVGESYTISGRTLMTYKYNLYVLVRCELDLKDFEKFTASDAESRQSNLKRLIRESGLRIRLIPLGITGTAYLELDFVKPEFMGKPLVIAWQPKTTYIPSVPSTLDQVTKALSEIPHVLNRDVYPVLRNVNEASKSFPSITEKIDEILANTRRITDDISDVVLELKDNPSRVVFGNAPPKKGVRR